MYVMPCLRRVLISKLYVSSHLILHRDYDSHKHIISCLGLTANIQLLNTKRQASGNSFSCTHMLLCQQHGCKTAQLLSKAVILCLQLLTTAWNDAVETLHKTHSRQQSKRKRGEALWQR